MTEDEAVLSRQPECEYSLCPDCDESFEHRMDSHIQHIAFFREKRVPDAAYSFVVECSRMRNPRRSTCDGKLHYVGARMEPDAELLT